jgi:hypothetical protein
MRKHRCFEALWQKTHRIELLPLDPDPNAACLDEDCSVPTDRRIDFWGSAVGSPKNM